MPYFPNVCHYALASGSVQPSLPFSLSLFCQPCFVVFFCRLSFSHSRVRSLLLQVVPGLKTALVDPLPEIRGVTARAFGAMVRGMGESYFDDLLPWMLQTLSAGDVGQVDRAGAAQGLAEVLTALGVERLKGMMDTFVANTNHSMVRLCLCLCLSV